MPKDVSILFNDLQKKFISIEKTRRTLERLYLCNKLRTTDIKLIYKGMFIEAVSNFEKFIEELFIGLIVEEFSHPSRRVRPLLKLNSKDICRNIIIGERSYVDWLPYDKFTEKRARRFFFKGLPFTSLSSGFIKRLNKILIIRNALAHNSYYSMKKFTDEFIIDQPLLLKKEKSIYGYLRGNYINYPPQTRFEFYLYEILDISKFLLSRTL